MSEHVNATIPDDVLLDQPRFDLAALTMANRQKLLGRLETIEMFSDIMRGSAREARRLVMLGRKGDADELDAVLLKADEIAREAKQIKAELNQ